MRCSGCGKKFNYEKYYGICPKCGCFNKNETTQEEQWPSGEKRSTLFLAVSLVCFCLAFAGGKAYTWYYRNHYKYQLENELKQDFYETEVLRKEHEVGESFSCQGITLTVMEAKVIDWEEGTEIPDGKKVIAIKIAGESNGKWEQKNQLRLPYIRCGDLYYHMFQGELSEEDEERYEIPMFSEYALCEKTHVEGWHLFFVDEWEQVFTRNLEGIEFEEIERIQTIHSIKFQLEGGLEQ